MPKFPNYAQRTTFITGSVFEKYGPKMQQMGRKLVKLHIGDTCLAPQYQIPIESAFIENNDGFNQYCNTFGFHPPRETLSEKVKTDNLLNAQPNQIMVTFGAINALNTSVQSLIDPDDDVLLLTPFWPFFKGMVKVAGGNGIEVPFYLNLYQQSKLNILD